GAELARGDLGSPQLEQLPVVREPAAAVRAARVLPAQHAALERLLGQRVGDARARLGVRERGKTRELLASAVAHRLAELAVEVAEEEERLVTGPLLAHEEERRRRREQEDGRQQLKLALVGERGEALAVRAVADLVVVLEEVDEAARRQMRAWLAARRAAEGRDFALVGEPLGERAREVVRGRFGIRGVVAVRLAGG